MSDVWTACDCEGYRRGCMYNPGWMTVGEAQKAVEAGFGDRLMLDWWDTDGGGRLYLLCPASTGSQGNFAPEQPEDFWEAYFWEKGTRVLFVAGRCAIHESGFKPWECRHAHHDRTTFRGRDHADFAALVAGWDTAEGSALVEAWSRDHAVFVRGRE